MTLFHFCLQMKEALSEIIQLATVDSEPWVLMVADILKSFPETGSLNLDLEEQNPNVQDILGELREKGRGERMCCRSRQVPGVYKVICHLATSSFRQ